MRNKLYKWLLGILFLLAFFTSLRIIALYWYHFNLSHGDYDLTMALMDKASVFNITSYITGILHGWVVGVILLIILNK
jgi:hypothetical protein